MKTLLYIFLVLLSLTTYSQELHIDSTRFITGLRVGAWVNYTISTSDKGILFVGYDYGNPGGIIPYFPLDTTFNNVLICKIDSNHQISWIKVFGGSNYDAANAACQTADGGYAVLAGTASSDGDVTGYKGGNDLWLLRLDASGNLLWENTYGGSASEGPISIAATPDSGFILLGTTNGSDGDVPFHYGSTWTFDWLVIKTDGSGNKQWSKDIGGTGDEQEQGSILSVDNSYYIVSGTNSTDHDCTDTVWHANVNTGDDYYILKLDDTGKVLWDSSYGGSGTDFSYQALFDARDSTIVINGNTTSADYMVTDSHGSGDMWVLKLNKNGTLVWEKCLGSPAAESGNSICISSNGGYAAYGGTNGVIGGSDAWVICVNNAGNEIVSKIFGGTDMERPSTIVPYLNGYAAMGVSGSKVFTEGTTYGNFDTSAIVPNGGGIFISYIDTYSHEGINAMSIPASAIAIYPNPAKNTIHIHLPEDNIGNLTIINGVGQVVYMGKYENIQDIALSMNEWSAGIYCVLWQDADGNTMTAKLIKTSP